MLKALHKLGLDQHDPDARCRPRPGRSRSAPATSSPPRCPTRPGSATGCSGKTCAGLWVTGRGQDGQPRSTYLYHVVDNAWTMSAYGAQCVVWQTAVNPVVALELLATGAWTGTGVLGPEAFDARAVPRPAGRARARRLRLAVGSARAAGPVRLIQRYGAGNR